MVTPVSVSARFASQAASPAPAPCSGVLPLDLPPHYTEKRFGSQLPQDSCALVAVRDLFLFHGLPDQAMTLEAPICKMLDNIVRQGTAGVDMTAAREAFRTFGPQIAGLFNIEDKIRYVHRTQDRALFLGGPPNAPKTKLSSDTILLFLAECGMQPRMVALNERDGARQAWQILDNYQPLLVSQQNSVPLVGRLPGRSAPATNHAYMLLKSRQDQQVYLYDINSKTPLPVPPDKLAEVFGEPECRAILLAPTPPVLPQRLL